VDTLTQIALGATIAEAGFRRRLGGRAVAFGAVCGALPDFDMALSFVDDWAVLIHHRGFSHSLLVLAVCAPLAGWLGYRWARRKTPYRCWVHLAGWALLTHPLLDLCTTYGTQLLWPISTRRLALDAVAILDPFYSLPLLLLVLVARLRRIPPASCRRLAVATLAVSTAYLIAGYVQSQRAMAIGAAQLHLRGFPIAEIRATPTLGNIWLWRIVARDEQGNVRVGFSSSRTAGWIRFEPIDRPNDPLVTAALRSPRGRTFCRFAGGMVSAEVERRGGDRIVHLRDQRYGLVTQPRTGLFAVAFYFDASDRLIEVRRLDGATNVDWAGEAAARWNLLRGRPGE